MGLDLGFGAVCTGGVKVLDVGREGGSWAWVPQGPGGRWTLGKQSTSVISGLEEASPEPVGTQVGLEESQEELTSGLDVGECEERAREMLGVGRDADEDHMVHPSAPPRVSRPVKCDSSPPPGFVGRPDWV